MMDPLETLDEKSLEAPKSRVKTVESARERVGELRRAEETRSMRRAKVKGLLNGNQPYSAQKMRDLGRAGDANINLRTGEGTVDAAKTPYYDLVFESQRFANIESDYGDDPQRWYEWGETISNGFHRLLDEWDAFDTQMQLKQWQMCVHGIGLSMFENMRDWRWKSRPIGDVLVKDDAEANIDELDECAIPRSYLPTRLFKLIEKEEAAKANKWKREAVKRAIIAAAPAGMREKYGHDWESYEDSLRCGDISWGNKSNRIKVVDYLLEEFDGTITRAMLLDEGGVPSSTEGFQKDDFLLHKQKYADSFSQILCPFFFDVVDAGLWHGVKGMGPKIHDFCDLENRMTGRLIDQAMAGVFVGAESADALQKMQLVPHGAVTVVPPGISFPNARIADNMQGQLAMKRDLQNTLQSNTGQYRQRVSDENQEPTLGQANLNAQQQAILGKGAVNRYYRSLDRLYKEMLRRALNRKLTKTDPGGKQALEFQEWCLMKGVPEEALEMKNICKVKAVRSVGSGSPAMRQIIGQMLMQMLPMMNEIGAHAAKRQILAPYVGTHVDTFFPPIEQADVPDDNAWAATMENNELRKQGGEVLVTPKQNHVIHFTIHFGSAMEHVQELQAGANPIEVLVHLHNAGPHMKEHLDAMSGDVTRKEQLAQMGGAWMQLSKMTDQLQQQVEEAAKAEAANQEAQQPQVDPKALAALMKVRGELELKGMKLQGEMALKAEKQAVTLKLKDIAQAHGQRLKNRDAMAAAAGPTEAVAA